MEQLTTLQGTLLELNHTTHTSGNDIISTKHISLFKVREKRVRLVTSMAPSIHEADEVILAGNYTNGEFIAIACKNLTSGWSTMYRPQTFAKVMLSIIIGVCSLLFFLVLPLLPAGFCIYLLIKVIKHDKILKTAYGLVNQSRII